MRNRTVTMPDGTRAFKSPPIHRTAEYRAVSAFKSMKVRCGNRSGKNPSYSDVELRMTMDEWLAWAIPRYAEFIECNPGVSPSVSRNGDVGHYEIGNISIISYLENRKLQKAIMQLQADGTKICGRCRIKKDSAEFYNHIREPDGLNRWCKACCIEHSREYMKTYKRKSRARS